MIKNTKSEKQLRRFHELRYTYASLMIDLGENIKYIQLQMGHSSVKMTLNFYDHLMNDVNTYAPMKLENCKF